jgi:hypothetical protein
MRGYVDIPADMVITAYKKILKKKRICKILPSMRFNMYSDGIIGLGGLVCKPEDGMNGDATGVAAEFCSNCTRRPHGRKNKKNRRG